MIVLANQNDTSGTVSSLESRPVVRRPRIRRLLHDHVFARGQRLQREVEMEARRHRNDHRVNPRVSDCRGVVAVARQPPVLLPERLGLCAIAARIAADQIAGERPQLPAMDSRDESTAEKGDVQGGGHRR